MATIKVDGPKARAGFSIIEVKVPDIGDFRDHEAGALIYTNTMTVDEFVDAVRSAAPMDLVEAERVGVASRFIKDFSKRMDIPAARMYDMLGVPKATAEKKVARQEPIAGTAGRAALGLTRLLGIAQDIVAESTAPEAAGFDTAKWLGKWLERPQPALGGRKPADLIDTSAGVEIVARLLGAIRSGAYQ